MPARIRHADEIYALIGEWVGARDVRTVEAAMVEAGVPCAPVLNVREIFEHPMIQGRGSIVNVPWEGVGLAMVAPVPRLSASPGEIRSAAPRPGQHTIEILESIGFDADSIAGLVSRRVVGDPNM